MSQKATDPFIQLTGRNGTKPESEQEYETLQSEKE